MQQNLEELIKQAHKAYRKTINYSVTNNKDIVFIKSIVSNYIPEDYKKHKELYTNKMIDYTLDCYNYYKKENYSEFQARTMALHALLSHAYIEYYRDR